MSAPSPDVALIAAYENWRAISCADYSAVDDEDGEAVGEADDEVLFSQRPQTIAGAAAILWRMISIVEQDRWFCRALVYRDFETLSEREDEIGQPALALVGCALMLERLARVNEREARI